MKKTAPTPSKSPNNTPTATNTPTQTPTQTPTRTPASNERDGGLGCIDGIDNDNDGLIDCADPDCQDQPPCARIVPTMGPNGTVVLAVVLSVVGLLGLARLRWNKYSRQSAVGSRQ